MVEFTSVSLHRNINIDLGSLTVGNTKAIGCSPLRTDWLCSLIRTPLEWCPFEDDLRALLFLSRCTRFILKIIFGDKSCWGFESFPYFLRNDVDNYSRNFTYPYNTPHIPMHTNKPNNKLPHMMMAAIWPSL